MNYKIINIIVFLIILTSCKLNHTNNQNDESSIIVNLKIKVLNEEIIDSIKTQLTDFGLVDLKIIEESDSLYQISFLALFDSIVALNLHSTNKIEFKETYDIESLQNEFLPILDDLETYRKIESETNQTNLDEVPMPLFSGATLGDYATVDTSKINIILNQLDFKNSIPEDLIFIWTTDIIQKDTLSLYLIKNRILDSTTFINQYNIKSIDASIKISHSPSEFDKNGEPKEWDVYKYYTIGINLDSIGSTKFYQLTKKNLGKHIAIFINDYIFSAPKVRSTIEGGNIEISTNGINDIKRFIYTIIFNNFEDDISLMEFETKTQHNKR